MTAISQWQCLKAQELPVQYGISIRAVIDDFLLLFGFYLVIIFSIRYDDIQFYVCKKVKC